MEIKFRNRIKALSLFANVGVAESYLHDVGVDVVVANELVEKRARFYRHLYPEVNMIAGDITDEGIYNEIIHKARLESVDFILATPPCQGMSCAGRKDPQDPRNSLIFYAIKAIKDLNPKFVLIENVPRQKQTKLNMGSKCVPIPEFVEAELSDNYQFNEKRVINAMDYGVPQSRQRYFYLLVRKDEGVHWEFPQPDGKIITLKDAIGALPSLDPLLREESERYRFPDYERKRKDGLKISKWHIPPLQTWKYVEWLIHTPTGCSAFQNEIFFPSKDGRRIKGGPQTYKRMSWDKPATTVMSNSNIISAFTTVHPGRVIIKSNLEYERQYSDPRVLTIYELLIISSLPLDWDIPDWASDCMIREVIGEGIPPLMVKRAIENLIVEGKYNQ